MVIFRPHGGGTVWECLEEAKEFETYQDMKEYIVSDWNAKVNDWFDACDIVVMDEECNDERIGWEDTRNVCIKRFGNCDYMKLYGCPQCIGFCATKYTKA